MNTFPVPKANYPCDLHTHTIRSDGNDTPEELINHASLAGLKVVAITDHDVLPPEKTSDGEIDICQYAEEKGIRLIKGIEFSCETEIQDVHVVCFGCDWSAKEIQEQIQEIVKSKEDSYLETINRLHERGYDICLEEVLSYGGNPIPLSELQKKRIFDLLSAKGYFPTWSDAKIFVRNDPYFSVEREKPPAKEIIRIAHKTGGIAILAHPVLIDPTVSYCGETIERWEFVDFLVESGLDGIESRYTYNKTTCIDKRPQEEIWKDVYERMKDRVFISGGSDYHADMKKGVKNPRFLGECGLTEDEFNSIRQLTSLINR